jgi:hypothetical protein
LFARHFFRIYRNSRQQPHAVQIPQFLDFPIPVGQQAITSAWVALLCLFIDAMTYPTFAKVSYNLRGRASDRAQVPNPCGAAMTSRLRARSFHETT